VSSDHAFETSSGQRFSPLSAKR